MIEIDLPKEVFRFLLPSSSLCQSNLASQKPPCDSDKLVSKSAWDHMKHNKKSGSTATRTEGRRSKKTPANKPAFSFFFFFFWRIGGKKKVNQITATTARYCAPSFGSCILSVFLFIILSSPSFSPSLSFHFISFHFPFAARRLFVYSCDFNACLFSFFLSFSQSPARHARCRGLYRLVIVVRNSGT